MLSNINFEETCFVIIDMQNDFLHPDGYFAVKQNWPVEQMSGIAAQIAKVKEFVRGKGGKVFYTATGYSPDGCDAYTKRHVIMPTLFIEPDGKPRQHDAAVIKDTWGSAILDSLKPKENDVVVPKRRFNAFYNTELDMMLKCNNIKTVVFSGVITEVCVESSVREAFARDYDVIVLSDCVGSWSMERHEASLKSMAFHCGPILTADEFMAL